MSRVWLSMEAWMLVDGRCNEVEVGELVGDAQVK